MMRKYNLNTCPVGLQPQNPDLRKLYASKPEHIINMMHFHTEDLREQWLNLAVGQSIKQVGHGEHLAPVMSRQGKDAWLRPNLNKTIPIERKG